MRSKLFFLLPMLTLFLLISCNDDGMSDAPTELYKKGPNANKPSDKTIFDLAEENGLLQLYGAIQHVDSVLNAGLEDAIKSNELQLTVFAPTDMAFLNLLTFLDAARPDETINDITDVPAPIVLAVLQYHLTDGRRASNSVVPKNRNNKTIVTLYEGATFEVDKDKMIFAVGNGAEIIIPDVSASNGIVHVIDTVILPLEAGDILDLWDMLIAQEN